MSSWHGSSTDRGALFSPTGEAADAERAIILCNALIDFGLVRHVTGDHWMENKVGRSGVLAFVRSIVRHKFAFTKFDVFFAGSVLRIQR
jgi:hypothetical protein